MSDTGYSETGQQPPSGRGLLRITSRIAVDERELQWSFARASGPGGQNVNSVSTAVELRLDVAGSACIPEPVKRRLRALAGRRLTSQGVLVIQAKRFRTQERNRRDARARLAELLREAAVPRRRRVATRPTTASREERLRIKRHRADRKHLRRRPDTE